MMEVIVEVCRTFALTVSAKKTETMCESKRSGKPTNRCNPSPTYVGGAVTETPDMPVEIARWTRACWMRIRR